MVSSSFCCIPSKQTWKYLYGVRRQYYPSWCLANKVLLPGTDHVNSLLRVCFTQEPIVNMTNLEQMLPCFYVCEDNWDFLRFLWFKNNDPKVDISKFPVKVHVFGDSANPAIAAYGRHKTVSNVEEKYGCDARHYVGRNFDVGDGLVSLPTPCWSHRPPDTYKGDVVYCKSMSAQNRFHQHGSVDLFFKQRAC